MTPSSPVSALVLDSLLARLPEEQQLRARKALEDPEILGIVVWRRTDGTFALLAFDAETDPVLDLDDPPEEGMTRVGWWVKGPDKALPLKQAEEFWLTHPGTGIRDVARHFGVPPADLYKLVGQRGRKPKCPTCGQTLLKRRRKPSPYT